jgi:competence protein ComEC
MYDQVLLFRLLLITFFLTLAVLIYVLPPSTLEISALSTNAATQKELTVAFLDVGQGDAIYIETPDGVQLLIDGGPDSAILRALPEVMPLFDRSIDVVLATHSDKDHIGGLVDVLARYTVETIVQTENTNDTSTAAAFTKAVENEGADLRLARAGQVYELGASTTLMILSPAYDPTDWESNAASIVAILEYGETSFLLTGDAGVNTEEYLIETYGPLLASDVLKLGHHGSDTSSSEPFLDMVRPTVAVVSAGRDNSYGHPHSSVVQSVEERGIGLFTTASHGTIIFKSDGRHILTE